MDVPIFSLNNEEDENYYYIQRLKNFFRQQSDEEMACIQNGVTIVKKCSHQPTEQQ